MAVYAGGQQIASNPRILQAGVATQALLDGGTIARQASTDLEIGRPCFYTAGGDLVAQTAATITGLFAGVVFRSNSNPLSWADSLLGYSNTLRAGLTAEILVRGSVGVPIYGATEIAGYPVRGSVVYVNPVTGHFITGTPGAAVPTGTVITNFRVGQTFANWTDNTIVEITNTMNVGA